jgi:hypothetical protein
VNPETISLFFNLITQWDVLKKKKTVSWNGRQDIFGKDLKSKQTSKINKLTRKVI